MERANRSAVNTKSHAVSDVLDRMYGIGMLHLGVEVEQVGVTFGLGWDKFTKGRLTYVVVRRGDKLYTMYVPVEGVRWLFDCYGE